MKNIFVLSTTLLTDNFLWYADYVLNFKIGNVYLIGENHARNDCYMAANQVIICDSIEEAIDYSDIIIIIYSEEGDSFPYSTIEKAHNHAVNKGKEVIIIKLKNDISTLNNAVDIKECNQKPVIINIGIGEASQQYIYEIMLNKLFVENKVPFYQSFSSYTHQILSELDKNKYLCGDISKMLKSTDGEYKIIVESISIDKTTELYEISHYIDELHPDYCIVCGDQCNINTKYIKNLFRYKYNCLTTIYKSYYVETNDGSSQSLYIKLINNKRDLFINREKMLGERILSSLAYPRGVRALN